MPRRLTDRNFEAMLEALIQYAAEGGRYSFRSDPDDGKLMISITVEDEPAYLLKHVEALSQTFPPD